MAAFYVSNVEEYLRREGTWNSFCANVARLPLDESSTFIRSVRGNDSRCWLPPLVGSGGRGFGSEGVRPEAGVIASSQGASMCDTGHHHVDGFGFLVDAPEVRELIAETRRVTERFHSNADRVEALRPAFQKLLSSDGWLPQACAGPDETSRMGGGIGQYALYRAEDGSLCLFSLVVPVGAETPVHDHLAWGIVGVYRGAQDETVYRRLDDGSDPEKAVLEVAKQQTLTPGECYTLPSRPTTFISSEPLRLCRRYPFIFWRTTRHVSGGTASTLTRER